MSYKDARRPAPEPKPAPESTYVPKPATAQTPPEPPPEPTAAETQRRAEDEAMADIYETQARRMKHALRILPWRMDAANGLSASDMSLLLQDVATCMHTIITTVTNVMSTVELALQRDSGRPLRGLGFLLVEFPALTRRANSGGPLRGPNGLKPWAARAGRPRHGDGRDARRTHRRDGDATGGD